MSRGEESWRELGWGGVLVRKGAVRLSSAVWVGEKKISGRLGGVVGVRSAMLNSFPEGNNEARSAEFVSSIGAMEVWGDANEKTFSTSLT